MDNNKKEINIKFNKKVVSISFLALALFMLLAVSYAYFTANVTGNESAKKTTVKTASMGLRLGGTKITELDNATPGTSHPITFTVTNTGNAETEYDLDIINVINTFATKSDLVYTIESNNGGGATTKEEIAPSESGHLIEKIKIGVGVTQTYTLTLTFKETHSNQNDNQGKIFSGKIQINNTENELAAAILSNNSIQDSKDIDFSKGSPYCNDTNCTSTTENGTGVFTAPDDDGTSYYFRGDNNKLNNNVNFAGQKWKIVRINGDGTIRLILNGNSNINITYFNGMGYAFEGGNLYMTSYANGKFINCTKENPCINDFQNGNFTDNGGPDIKVNLEKWYKQYMASYDDYIALSTYCNDTSIIEQTYVEEYNLPGTYTYYGATQRIFKDYKPILTCPDPVDLNGEMYNFGGGLLKLKVGLLSADEVMMAGSGTNSSTQASENNYLYDLISKYGGSTSYSMSPYYGSDIQNNRATVIAFNGSYLFYTSPDVSTFDNVFPIINLKADVTFTGEGTESNPYTITN